MHTASHTGFVLDMEDPPDISDFFLKIAACEQEHRHLRLWTHKADDDHCPHTAHPLCAMPF